MSLTLSPRRRLVVPLCLTLGALLCALPARPAPADPPAAPVASAPAQTMPLQHTVPGDLLKSLHWDQAANLPADVTQVRAVPETNSLSVVATPAGLAQVRQIVALMDIAPRQVQIKFALAHATNADLAASSVVFESAPLPSLLTVPMPRTEYASGNGVAAFLQTLTKQGAVTQAPSVTTSNNTDASVTLSTTLPAQSALSETFAVTPRVNSDDSVTLVLHPVLLDGMTKREINTTRTVKSGDTMVLVVPLASSPTGGKNPKNLLLFVTPTVLGDTGAAAITVK